MHTTLLFRFLFLSLPYNLRIVSFTMMHVV